MSQLRLLGFPLPDNQPTRRKSEVVPTCLTELLDKRGIPYPQAADLFDVNKGQIAGYATGETAIPTGIVHRICQKLNVSPNSLYGIDEPDCPLNHDGKPALNVPVTLSKRLYYAVTQAGRLDSQSILGVSSKLQGLLGLNNPVTVWLRQISDVVRDIEYWANGTDKPGKI